MSLDVALVQVSPPDKFGYCSLGVSVDITRSGLENARLVIGQVNPRMPRTWGDSFVHVDEIDWLVPCEEPLVEMLPEVGIEPANLSQQLSILRRAGLVTARREGLSVSYTLTSPKVADLLAIAKGILTGVVAGQAELLEEQAESAVLVGEAAG